MLEDGRRNPFPGKSRGRRTGMGMRPVAAQVHSSCSTAQQRDSDSYSRTTIVVGGGKGSPRLAVGDDGEINGSKTSSSSSAGFIILN